MDKAGFDLKQATRLLKKTKDDLDILCEEVLEGSPSKDEVANALVGIASLHGMRSAKAQRIFEELVRLATISHIDKLASVP
jgi:hypothetical protein